MPWCDDCDRYYAPSAMQSDGSCPECGQILASKRGLRSEARLLRLEPPVDASAEGLEGVDRAGESGGAGGGASRPGAVPGKVPWHFKVMLVALALYLGWRLVQGVVWVVHALD